MGHTESTKTLLVPFTGVTGSTSSKLWLQPKQEPFHVWGRWVSLSHSVSPHKPNLARSECLQQGFHWWSLNHFQAHLLAAEHFCSVWKMQVFLGWDPQGGFSPKQNQGWVAKRVLSSWSLAQVPCISTGLGSHPLAAMDLCQQRHCSKLPISVSCSVFSATGVPK